MLVLPHENDTIDLGAPGGTIPMAACQSAHVLLLQHMVVPVLSLPLLFVEQPPLAVVNVTSDGETRNEVGLPNVFGALPPSSCSSCSVSASSASLSAVQTDSMLLEAQLSASSASSCCAAAGCAEPACKRWRLKYLDSLLQVPLRVDTEHGARGQPSACRQTLTRLRSGLRSRQLQPCQADGLRAGVRPATVTAEVWLSEGVPKRQITGRHSAWPFALQRVAHRLASLVRRQRMFLPQLLFFCWILLTARCEGIPEQALQLPQHRRP